MATLAEAVTGKREDDGGSAMTARIRRFYDRLATVRQGRFSVSIAKAQLMTRAFQESEGQPQVLRVAHAFETVLREIPVFIEPDDLLAGNMASRPDAIELSSLWAPWGEDELDALVGSGFAVDPADRPEISRMNAYWADRCLTARMTSLYDDDRLWPYAQLGVVLPPFRSKTEGWGPGGMLGCGWGIHHEISQIIAVFDYERVLRDGLAAHIREAEEKLAATRLVSAEDIHRADLLRAILISLRAIADFATRLADAAEQEAGRATEAGRRRELLAMASACRQVPLGPARSFREAMQSLWIMYLMILPAGVLSFGRLDQLLIPYYRADLESGAVDVADALELLQWLRVKDSQIVITSGQTHRNKYGGLAKWHNCVIGGQTADGRDATNDLTYLILEAARTCPSPHPTLTLRVHEGTPEKLLETALDLVATGVGLPAFLSDKSCIDFLQREGVALDKARNYAVAGCLGVNIIGESRMVASPMFVAPLVLNFALFGGIDPRTGQRVGPETLALDRCASFDHFLAEFKRQLVHFLALQAEFNNVTIHAYGERFPQPVESALTAGGIGADRNLLGRTMPFENGSAINPIGLINVVDSLAAIRKLVFEDGTLTASDLLRHLQRDWSGPDGERAQALALAAPKFGNDDDYVDAIAVDLFDFCVKSIGAFTTSYGGRCKGSALTIGTCVLPGGIQTGPTPDGRRASESLADEAVSAMRGHDRSGLSAAFRSAAKIDQAAWQSLAMDVRVAPGLLRSAEGRSGTVRLIRDYFAAGGKHVQFNAVDGDVLRQAQADPAAHDDLIVRIGGCSAYFTQLDPRVQDELIQRTEFNIAG